MVTVGSLRSSHVYRSNGIHEFALADASTAAVDELLEQLSTLYRNVSSDETMRILVDVRRSSMQSMVYAFRRAEKWLAAHPQRPQTYCAFLTHAEVVRALKATYITLVRSGDTEVTRFFPVERHEQAIAWLRAVW